MIKRALSSTRKNLRINPWLLLGILTILVISYFSVRNHNKFERTIFAQTHDQLLTTARSISASIRNHAAVLSRTLTIISENRALQKTLISWEPGRSRFDPTLLADIVQAHETDADALTILDSKGRVVYQYPQPPAHAPVETSLADRDDVAHVLSLKLPAVSAPFRTPAGELVFTDSQPIFARNRGGEFVGIARWLIKIDTMTGLFVSNVRIGDTGSALVIDGTGMLLAAAEPAQLGRPLLENARAQFPDADLSGALQVLADMQAGREGTAIVDLPDLKKNGGGISRKLVAYAPIALGDQSWSVLLSQNYSEVAAPIQQSAVENVLFALCLTGIILYAGQRYFRIRNRLALNQAQQDWQDTFNAISDCITIHDNDFTIIAANKAAWAMLSLRPGGREKCYAVLHGKSRPAEDCPGCKGMDMGREARTEIFEPHLGRHIEIRVIPRTDSSGARTGIIHIVRDISDRKLLEDELKHRALYDHLTRLPNRMLFHDRLKNLFAHLERQKQLLFAVLFIDLDHFKKVNDTAGHAVGDRLLIAVAERLRQNTRPGDTISRFGGDEFLIIMDDLKGADDAVLAAKRIRDAFEESFVVGGSDLYVTASIGIALSEPEGMTPEDLIRNADLAMYHAKSLGRSAYALFDPSMHSHILEAVKLETELRNAVKRQEFVNHYQPVVDSESGMVMGFEALTRWLHPKEGMMPPAKFIPVAEETGMISAIGEWATREAARQIKAWRDEFPERPDLFVTINISAKQFSEELPDFVGGVLREFALPPDALRIEITESLLMEHTVVAHEVLMKLQAMGIKVYLDDFGTGYSSLNYLHKFPINVLKIDRTFVMNIVQDRQAQEIIKAIRMLASSLNLTVIVEGVERQDQLEFFRGIECKLIQGFLFSPAVEHQKAAKYITRRMAPVEPPL